MTADAAPDDKPFTWALRVYYEDTDLSGVVYHANYLRFLERARTEWLRSLGFGQDKLLTDTGVAFTLADIAVEFRKPARLDDQLAVTVEVDEVRRASFRLSQTITRLTDADRTLLTTASTRVACVDRASFAPRPVPAAIHACMLGRAPA